jgi:hypothetical protein
MRRALEHLPGGADHGGEDGSGELHFEWYKVEKYTRGGKCGGDEKMLQKKLMRVLMMMLVMMMRMRMRKDSSRTRGVGYKYFFPHDKPIAETSSR